jgi:hypothetical protein
MLDNCNPGTGGKSDCLHKEGKSPSGLPLKKKKKKIANDLGREKLLERTLEMERRPLASPKSTSPTQALRIYSTGVGLESLRVFTT